MLKHHERRKLPGHVIAIYEFLSDIIIGKPPKQVQQWKTLYTTKLIWEWWPLEHFHVWPDSDAEWNRCFAEINSIVAKTYEQVILELGDGILTTFGIREKQITVYYRDNALYVEIVNDLSENICSDLLKRRQREFKNHIQLGLGVK